MYFQFCRELSIFWSFVKPNDNDIPPSSQFYRYSIMTHQISTDMVKLWRITNKFLEVLSIFIAVTEAGK